MGRRVAHGAVGCERGERGEREAREGDEEEGRARAGAGAGRSGKRDRLGECIQGEKIFTAWEKDANGYVRVVIGA